MEILPEYKNMDTIYHYTKLNTSLEGILYSGNLRLSPRNGTVDPYEKNKLFIHFSNVLFSELKTDEQEKGDEVKKQILNKYDSIRQISFCMNDNSINIENHTGHGPLEYYGFLKPRMWEQYGDSYKGICLALSLNRIVETFKKTDIPIIHNKVKYERSSYIKSFDYGVDMKKLADTSMPEFIKEYFKRVEKRTFTKYQDYRDENEYKICSYSKDCFIPFSISDCLIGIIYCEKYVPDIYIELLETYANKYNVSLTLISFGNQGINIKNKI